MPVFSSLMNISERQLCTIFTAEKRSIYELQQDSVFLNFTLISFLKFVSEPSVAASNDSGASSCRLDRISSSARLSLDRRCS
jgi:hypothetical protein